MTDATAAVPLHDALPQHALPVIDISPFITNPEADGEEAKKKVARAVHDACVESGFFLIRDYQGVLPQDKVDGLLQLMRRFFSLAPPASAGSRAPTAENARVGPAMVPSAAHSYFAYGEENLSTIYPEHNVNFEDKDLGDYKEGLDFGPEVPPTDPHYGELFHTPNQWPDPASVGEEWKAQVLEYFELASRLGHVLNRIFALSLGLPENWFEDRICPPLPTLRLLHYPPSPVEQTRMGCGAHSDYGCCAILAQDDAGGLELYDRKGQWVAVKPVPQTLVINIGDMMQRWTNDRYKSTLHRVINPSTGKHRFSSPFFFEPSVDCMVECVPTCLAEGESPRYPPTRFGDHLLNMYSSTFYVNPTDQSGHDGDPGASTVLPRKEL